MPITGALGQGVGTLISSLVVAVIKFALLVNKESFQISDERLTAISKAWSGAVIEEPAMMINVYPASIAA